MRHCAVCGADSEAAFRFCPVPTTCQFAPGPAPAALDPEPARMTASQQAAPNFAPARPAPAFASPKAPEAAPEAPKPPTPDPGEPAPRPVPNFLRPAEAPPAAPVEAVTLDTVRRASPVFGLPMIPAHEAAAKFRAAAVACGFEDPDKSARLYAEAKRIEESGEMFSVFREDI